ncbi:MAG: hypothetical protein DMF62_17015 [Acidobacteria bacterium]|nr:MAG: hypothetical protein DMF62_17015 [Acidobacteriota bacterium]
MKKCPTCERSYSDDTLNFCLEDGHWLVDDVQETPTVILPVDSANEPPTKQHITLHTAAGPRIAFDHGTSNRIDQKSNTRSRKSRYIFIGGLALFGIIAISAAAFWNFTPRNRSAVAPSVSRTVQVTTWSGLDLFPTISRDGRMIAFSSDRSGSFEIYVKQLVAGARDIQVTSDGNQNLQPSLSPDGSFIAFHSKTRGGIWMVPSTGGTARQLSNFGSAPAFSPDGLQVAFQSDPLNDISSNVRNALPPSTIWTVVAVGGEPMQLTSKGEPPGGHGHPSWSPDGKKLVFDVSDWASARLACFDLTSRAVKLLKIDDGPLSDPIFSADGEFVYFSANMNTTLQQMSVDDDCEATGKAQSIFDSSGARIRQIAVDGSGKRIAYSTLATTSNIWSMPVSGTVVGQPEQITHAALTRSIYPAFSPDGTKIAFQRFSAGNLSHLWLINSDGSNEMQIGTQAAVCPIWARDGSRIWFISPQGDATSMWYITPDGATERKLFDFGEEVYIAKPSPDGKWMAYQSKQSGTSNVFLRSSDGSQIRQMTFDEESAGFPAWSPDGKWLGIQLKRGADSFIGVMPSDGGPITQLTNEPGQSWVNDWAANGDEIIFAGQRSGIWNLYAVSRSTMKQRKLTNFTKLNTYVRYPVWSPANDRLAFEYAETTGNIWMVELK